jgi:hypothetical protein
MNEAEQIEFLEGLRAKCRESETAVFETEVQFKYNARTYWWAYLQQAQLFTRYVMPFREFWNSEETYSRTIAA